MEKYFFSPICVTFVILAGVCMACGGKSETKTEPKKSETTVSASSDTSSAPDVKLNINTATADQFKTIPDVGDRMVHEFKEYRPYVSIRQFRAEIGKYVDEAQVAAYEKYIYVPIHRNESDAATLQQIPGLDTQEAEELISRRPYDTNQAFFEALSPYISDEQMIIAKIYMKKGKS